MKLFSPKTLLHIEGLVLLGLSSWAYFFLAGPLWLFAILILAPDIGMLGYATHNKKIGSYLYNTFHTYTFPALLGAFALTKGLHSMLLIALIWIAHIGMDRLFGYGLKFETRFKDTHLQRLY